MSISYGAILDRKFGGSKFSVLVRDHVLTRATLTRVNMLIGDAVKQDAFRRARVVGADGREFIDESRTSESIGVSNATGLADAIRLDVARAFFDDERLARAVCPDDDATLQIQRYGLGGHFDLHHDAVVVPEGLDTPATPGVRLVTVFLYLTDGFGGGATVFPFADTSVVPARNRGAAWANYRREAPGLFVADARAQHIARPIVPRLDSAYKYGMNVWFCYVPGIFGPERPFEVITVGASYDVGKASKNTAFPRAVYNLNEYLKAHPNLTENQLAVDSLTMTAYGGERVRTIARQQIALVLAKSASLKTWKKLLEGDYRVDAILDFFFRNQLRPRIADGDVRKVYRELLVNGYDGTVSITVARRMIETSDVERLFAWRLSMLHAAPVTFNYLLTQFRVLPPEVSVLTLLSNAQERADGQRAIVARLGAAFPPFTAGSRELAALIEYDNDIVVRALARPPAFDDAALRQVIEGDAVRVVDALGARGVLTRETLPRVCPRSVRMAELLMEFLDEDEMEALLIECVEKRRWQSALVLMTAVGFEHESLVNAALFLEVDADASAEQWAFVRALLNEDVAVTMSVTDAWLEAALAQQPPTSAVERAFVLEALVSIAVGEPAAAVRELDDDSVRELLSRATTPARASRVAKLVHALVYADAVTFVQDEDDSLLVRIADALVEYDDDAYVRELFMSVLEFMDGSFAQRDTDDERDRLTYAGYMALARMANVVNDESLLGASPLRLHIEYLGMAKIQTDAQQRATKRAHPQALAEPPLERLDVDELVSFASTGDRYNYIRRLRAPPSDLSYEELDSFVRVLDALIATEDYDVHYLLDARSSALAHMIVEASGELIVDPIQTLEALVDQCAEIEIFPRVRTYCADDKRCKLRDDEGQPLADVVEELTMLFVEDLLNCMRTRTRFKQADFDDVHELLSERLRDYLLDYVAGDENVGMTDLDKMRIRFDTLEEIIISGELPKLERVAERFPPGQAELIRKKGALVEEDFVYIYDEYKSAIAGYNSGDEYGRHDDFGDISFDSRTVEEVLAARTSRRPRKLGRKVETNVRITKDGMMKYIRILREVVSLAQEIGEAEDALAEKLQDL